MPLSLRLMLVLLLPIAACFGAYAYVNVSLRRAEMTVEAAREAADIGTAVEVALDNFLRDRNLEDIAELVEELPRADRILGVAVFDEHMRLVRASRALGRPDGSLFASASQALHERRTVRSNGTFQRRRVFVYAFPVMNDADPSGRPRASAIVLRDLGYIDHNLGQSARRIALAGLITMLCVALASWLAVRTAVLRPLARLLHGFEQVASGALEVEVPDARSDEIGRMAGAFNQMTASLRSARIQLEAQHAANVALVNRLNHAQRLALVGQMAASVAHQIGSPLNVILGRARYALKQGGQGERDVRHFEEIAAGAEKISRVIEGLLSRARRTRPPAGDVDVGELATQVLGFLETDCERRKIVATARVTPGAVVEGVRDEIEQVVLNLCVNAMQAQPDGGALTVTVHPLDEGAEDGDGVEILVDDAGEGIASDARDRVFDPFYTTKSAGEGTGLGLSICDEIVRALGGTITVGDAPGGGARFRVVLPRHPGKRSGRVNAGGA